MVMAVADAYAAGPSSPAIVDITVGEVLRRAAARGPDRPALVEGVADRTARRRWTYGELLRDAEACAGALLARYEPGDRVAVWAPNIADYQVLQYGLALAGMVMVTVNPAFRRPEVRYVLEQSGAVACFAATTYRDRPLLEVARELRDELPALRDVVGFDAFDQFVAGGGAGALPDVDPRSPAQILYTSGTTGAPKGAMLAHRAMANNVAHGARIIAAGKTHDAVWMAALPMFHLASCVVATVGTASLGGTLLTVPAFDAGLGLALIEEEGVTTMNIVPTLLLAMLQSPSFTGRDVRSVHSVMLGGAPIPAELVRRVHAELDAVSIVAYGLTEAAMVTMTTADDTPEDQSQTCGLPLPGVEIRIVDPGSGEPSGRGDVGELLTRGFHTMLGYHEDPDATAATIDADGWLRTGDLCSMDERGYLKVEGRAKDMIIRGGENIYPREIEDELLRHPGVADAAVVGLPDAYYGEIAAAFVRTLPGHDLTAAELADDLRTRLTGYKVPAKWFFVEDYPKTPSGKIQKFALRQAWERGIYEEAPG
jgi:fatty-acyl-CoA synthase